jgi:hypothetical protein
MRAIRKRTSRSLTVFCMPLEYQVIELVGGAIYRARDITPGQQRAR